MVLLKCRKLSLGYGNKCIVRDFDYEIHAEDYLCVVGENGCGKTTFLRGLAGILRPRSGSIEFCEGLKRSQVGFLPQIGAAQKDFLCRGNRLVGISGQTFSASFLQQGSAKACRGMFGNLPCGKSAETVLPRSLRRSKAAGFSRPGILCGRKAPASRRTGHRPRPGIR